MKKTYLSNGIKWVRLGKALIKLEFTNGEYTTANPLFQKAIENSEHFEQKLIRIKNESS
jgi:hypothetical protein